MHDPPATPFDNLPDLLASLGHVAPAPGRLRPPPGQATAPLTPPPPWSAGSRGETTPPGDTNPTPGVSSPEAPPLPGPIPPARRSAEVYLSADAPAATLTDKDSLDGGDVLPGFSLPL